MTAVALDAHSQPLGSQRVAMTDRAAVQLLAWAAPWPARRWAVEGATGLGHTVAQQLVGAGELVVDVPAKLAARARLLGAGSPARPIEPTQPRSPRSRCTIAACARSPSRTTRWRCGCSPTAATTWSPSAPAR